MLSCSINYGILFAFIANLIVLSLSIYPPFYEEQFWDPLEKKYGNFPENLRLESLQQTKDMFYFAYDNYMKYAFPKDELDPIHCVGRGPDYDNPSNININDVLGDYALTLIDVLDTLAIMGNMTEFENAVRLIIEYVSFDKSNTVQLFEANIRVLGALLSAHLIITDPLYRKYITTFEYDNELLNLSSDLATRLLSAFDNTATGVPHPRINLQNGVPCDTINETCTAGAGSLRLEFGILSRLLNDPIYDRVAKKAVDKLWSLRSNVTGLFGNVLNIQTGQWVGVMSGLGAGLDSYYEYLFKSFILFGDTEDLNKFNKAYESVKHYLRRGREKCNNGSGFPPIYINVNMFSGELLNNWVDSLQASWSAVQVLFGDIEEAICSHAFYFTLWQRFNAIPERYNWLLHKPEVSFYPLRPEFVESTYHLYRATLNPFYLHVGRQILQSINDHAKVSCGYATRHDVTTNELEDRMESFFLSETCKYLYLLFDTENFVNKNSINFLFTTEGHLLPITSKLRNNKIDEFFNEGHITTAQLTTVFNISSANNCENFSTDKRFTLPILPRYLNQLQQMIGS